MKLGLSLLALGMILGLAQATEYSTAIYGTPQCDYNALADITSCK